MGLFSSEEEELTTLLLRACESGLSIINRLHGRESLDGFKYEIGASVGAVNSEAMSSILIGCFGGLHSRFVFVLRCDFEDGFEKKKVEFPIRRTSNSVCAST